jgi:hypothetical protein
VESSEVDVEQRNSTHCTHLARFVNSLCAALSLYSHTSEQFQHQRPLRMLQAVGTGADVRRGIAARRWTVKMSLSSKRAVLFSTRPGAIGVNLDLGDSGKGDGGDQSRRMITNSMPDSLPGRPVLDEHHVEWGGARAKSSRECQCQQSAQTEPVSRFKTGIDICFLFSITHQWMMQSKRHQDEHYGRH